MKHVVSLLVIGLLFISSVAHAQLISSDMDFVRHGPPEYDCHTWEGEQVCNRWYFNDDSGWRHSCVEPGDSPFSVLDEPTGQGIEIRRPASGCVALYDWTWTTQDTPATFWQYVTVPEAGEYELRFCTAAHFLGDLTGSDLIARRTDQGGILAKIVDEDTVIAHIPQKARFGGVSFYDNPRTTSQGITWVDELPRQGRRRDVVAIQHSSGFADAYVHDGRDWFFVEPDEIKQGMYIDGYQGHAGLLTAYHPISTLYELPNHGMWTCHSGFIRLDPKVYRIEAETLETFHFDLDDRIIGGHFRGFGGIRQFFLRKVGR